MTKGQLITALQGLPDNTELYLAHPNVMGAIIPLRYLTTAAAGTNPYIPKQAEMRHLQRNYPDVVDVKLVALLGLDCASLVMTEIFST